MNEQAESNSSLAYLITLRSYGTWLHGDDRGSVDRHGFNIYATPRMFPSEKLKRFMKLEMKQDLTIWDKKEGVCILAAIKEVCDYRGYELLAINIRTNHLHSVVSADTKPEKFANEFKSYATRRLREAGLVEKDKNILGAGEKPSLSLETETYRTGDRIRFVRARQRDFRIRLAEIFALAYARASDFILNFFVTKTGLVVFLN